MHNLPSVPPYAGRIRARYASKFSSTFLLISIPRVPSIQLHVVV